MIHIKKVVELNIKGASIYIFQFCDVAKVIIMQKMNSQIWKSTKCESKTLKDSLYIFAIY
jgi:ribosomal protein L37AE/L43A